MIDKKHIGYEFPPVTVPVEEWRLKFLAKSLGETRGIYSDQITVDFFYDFLKKFKFGFHQMSDKKILSLDCFQVNNKRLLKFTTVCIKKLNAEDFVYRVFRHMPRFD